jgi:hypothetical protein
MREVSHRRTTVFAFVVMCLVCSGCARENPERAALRERLKQTSPLSNEELGRLGDEVSKTMAGKTFLREGAESPRIEGEQRAIVFGMLTEPAGLFDEGLRENDGVTCRVINAPGISNNAEIEASRRLWIDVETLLPRRFEFAYAFPGLGDYSFDLTVER